MTKFTTLTTATAILVAATATPAFAGEMMKETTTVTAETTTVRTIDGDNQVGQVTIFTAGDANKSAVLGALAEQKTDAYIVADQAGNVYINHLIPVEELPDPTLSVDTIDTYEVTYNGMVFTNRIVETD